VEIHYTMMKGDGEPRAYARGVWS